MTALLFIYLSCANVWADSIGEVLKHSGEVILERNSVRSELVQGQELELNDKIVSLQGMAQLLIYPSMQINLGGKTEIILSEQTITGDENDGEARGLIRLIQGELRLLIEKWGKGLDQKVEADGAIFGVRGTEFELETLQEGTDLEVFEGQVDVSDDGEQVGSVKPAERMQLPRKLRGQKRKLLKRALKRKSRGMEFASAVKVKERRKERFNRLRERRDRREERAGQKRGERRARRKSN